MLEKDKPSANVETSDALREIAGRLKRLSFRDMVRLSDVIDANWRQDKETSFALLTAADCLEGK